VQIDPSVSLEELARVAHSLGEVVGLGLRNLAHCPVEMNLMPDSTLRWQAFNEKKPYFLFTVFSLVLVAFAVGFLFEKLAQSKEAEIQNLDPKVQQITAKSDAMKRAYSRLQAAQKEADQITSWMEERYYWADVLTQLRAALIRSEEDTRKKLSAQKPNVEAGIWIEQMTTMPDLQGAGGMAANPPPPNPDGSVPSPNQMAPINLICRAVNLSGIDPSANSEIAYAVENELKNSTNYFDPKTTQLTGQITPDDVNGTFTFGITVTLLNPLQL
jgi:hypothetical protein